MPLAQVLGLGLRGLRGPRGFWQAARVGLVVALALPAGPAGAETQAAPGPSPTRLGDALQPRAATLAITLDPAQAQHRGTVSFELSLARPQTTLVLHAHDLQLGPAFVEVGAHRLPLVVQRLDAERVALRPHRPLAAGALRLSVDFSSRSGPGLTSGLVRYQETGQAYAATRWLAQGARRVFPLIDEPGWRMPWTLLLTVPEGLTAVANTPLAEKEGADRPGWQTWRFGATPPLPGGGLAFAVGPFDSVVAGSAGPLPLRVLTPRGRAGEARSAVALSADLVGRIEQVLGVPYPFTKLDILALPAALDAPDHARPGLHIMASHRLLAPPGEDGPAFRRALAAQSARLSAQAWFGGLVGPAAWDQQWLGDALSSWLGDHVVEAAMPAGERALPIAALRRGQALRPNPRAATAAHGQALMSRLESWLGPPQWLAVLRRLIDRHAWGQASHEDWLAAVASVDAALANAVPALFMPSDPRRLEFSLLCPAGAAPSVRVTQSPLWPIGAVAVAGRGGLAQVPLPLVLRTPVGTQRLLLAAAEATLALTDPSCPAWLVPNVGGLGAYRSQLAPAALDALLASGLLSAGELIALTDDLRALHEAGALDSASVLAAARLLARQARPQAVEAAIELLEFLRPLAEVTPGSTWAQHWQQIFGARARALGWLPRPEDTEDDRQLRSRLLPRVAAWGEDTMLRELARVLVQGWVDGRHGLPTELREALLVTAALQGEAALFDRYAAALLVSRHGPDEPMWWRALGHFRQPALADRARERLLDAGVDLREALPQLLSSQGMDAGQRLAALAFLSQYQRALTRRLGGTAGWLRSFDHACSPAEAEALRRQVAASADELALLEQKLEAIQRCTAWRAQHGALPSPVN